MKKLLGILVLCLSFSTSAYALKIKLICQGPMEIIEGSNFYINFDDETIDVLQGIYGNKVTFKVDEYDEYTVKAKIRSLYKGDTTYDTHVTDWTNWDSKDYIKHLYGLEINRIKGLAYILRSQKPYKEGKKTYKMESWDNFGYECKKSRLSGKF